MPRQAREESPTQIYHVTCRGINKEMIFEMPYFKKYYLKLLHEFGEECKVSIYAYCIMGNHCHLLLKGELEELFVLVYKYGHKKLNTL